jgi:hypothetical protein
MVRMALHTPSPRLSSSKNAAPASISAAFRARFAPGTFVPSRAKLCGLSSRARFGLPGEGVWYERRISPSCFRFVPF